MGTLYIVATPIGNLEDITLRALRVLREAALIAAEDTRQTRKLLARYEIEGQLISYHQHNRLTRIEDVLMALIAGDVALVSDAGTPGLSDPGLELIQSVIGAGFPVVPVPGPHAAAAGLVASGLDTARYLFLGFPPRKSSERRTFFEMFAATPATLVLYEAPHRIVDCLDDAHAVLGNRYAAVAREITKLHEQIHRGHLRELYEHFEGTQPRGEMVLLIEGVEFDLRRAARQRPAQPTSLTPDEGQLAEAGPPDDAALSARLRELRDAGVRGTQAVKTVAREHDLPRDHIYKLWTEL